MGVQTRRTLPTACTTVRSVPHQNCSNNKQGEDKEGEERREGRREREEGERERRGEGGGGGGTSDTESRVTPGRMVPSRGGVASSVFPSFVFHKTNMFIVPT